MLFALASAVMYALMNVYVRKGQARKLPDGGLLVTVTVNMAMLSVMMAGMLFVGDTPPLTLAGVIVFIAAGLLTTALGRGLQFQAMRYIGPARSASYRASSPVVTMIIAVFLLGEQPTAVQVLGVLVVGAGVWTLMRKSGTGHVGGNRLGTLLAMLAAASFGAGHATRKLGLDMIPSPYIGAWIGSVVGFTAVVLQLKATNQLKETLIKSFRPLERNLLAAGVLSGIAQFALYLSFFLAPVSLATALSSTEPLWTVFLVRFMLGSEVPLSRIAVLGIVSTVIGVVLIVLD